MKTPNPPSAVTIAILTTITIVFWIFYSVYQLLSSTPSTDVPIQVLAPIEPKLDSQTLSELPSKIYFDKNEYAQLPESISLTQNSVPEDVDINEPIDKVESPADTDQGDSQEIPGVPEEELQDEETSDE